MTFIDMKKLKLVRIYRGTDRTLGKLFLSEIHNDRDCRAKISTHLCDTLEPCYRDLQVEKKIKGKTAIPEGQYKIVLSPSSKFHKIMPFLQNVPQFNGVMIHPGNTPKDTQGCILTGTLDGNNLKLSRIAFDKILRIIKTHNVNTIEIKNNF